MGPKKKFLKIGITNLDSYKQYVKVPKHFAYIQSGCGIQSEASCSLNHDITTSLGLRSSPKKTKSAPHLHRLISVRVNSLAIHTISTIFQASKTLCIHPIWMWGPLMPTVASTMTLQHHSGSDLPPKKQNHPPTCTGITV